MNLQKWFLMLSLFFGAIIVFITPPFQAPDEYNHYFRALGIANGDIIPHKIKKNLIREKYSNFLGSNEEASDFYVGSYISKGPIILAKEISDDLPGNVNNKQDLNLLFEKLNFKIDSEVKIFVSYPNTALYSPILYLPSVLAILLGRLFNFSYLVSFYFARLFNLFTYTLLIYFAIKYSPFLKLTILLLALMPMSIFLGGSISSDSLVIALSFLIFSLVGSLYVNFRKRIFYILVLVSFLIGISKSAYFLLPFISIVLFKKQKKFEVFLPILASISGFSIWFALSNDLFVPLRIGVDPYRQIATIVQTPFKFIQIFLRTLIGNRNYIINQFVGNLGWLDVPLNIYLSYFYISFLVLSSILSNKILKLSGKVVNFAVASASFLLVSVMMYLSWTPIGNQEILGLVGKNFIPISIYGLAPLSSVVRIKEKDLLKRFLRFIPIPVLIYTIYALVIRYYLP